MDRLGIGLIGAVALGTAAGIVVAPESGRRVFAARARRESNRLATLAREQAESMFEALPDFVESVERAFSAAASSLTERVRTVNPTAKLEAAFASDPALSRRTIWVDAHGA